MGWPSGDRSGHELAARQTRFCYDGQVYDTGSSLCVTPGSAIPYAEGRLTGQGAQGVSATNFTSFDQLGRVLASEQKIHDGSAYQTYAFAYAYNLNGSLKSQTYPSGRVVDFTYDGSGRPSSVQEPSGGPSYLNSVAYTAHGAIDNMQLGNLLVEQTCYNDLLQPTDRRLGNATSSNCAIQTSTDLLHLGFDYGASTTNNGNMLQQTIWAPDNGTGSPWQVTQDYTYDQVNRIEKAEEKLGGVLQWSRDYAYDHFGNRWISGNWGHTLHMATPKSQSAIQTSTNRLTGAGITYDNAGNLTAHPHITTGSGSMAYDANNKMKSFTATGVAVTTTYDAAARRVRKVYNSETTVWVYDAFGKLAAEYTTESLTDVATYFRTTDHLGSTRLTTDAVGDVVARRDFFPFGERIDSNLSGRNSVLDGALLSFSSGPGMRQEFTGQQQDAETGLDYFWARNYNSAVGRFLSIDPEGAGARGADPQRWNAFAYVANRPIHNIDPDGRDIINCNVDIETGRTTNRYCDSFFLRFRQGQIFQHPLIQVCEIDPSNPDCAELEPQPEDPEYGGPLSRLDVGFDELEDPEPVLEAGFGLSALVRASARVALQLIKRHGADFIKRAPRFARSGLKLMTRDELNALRQSLGQNDALRRALGNNISGARSILARLRSGGNITMDVGTLTREGAEVYRALAQRVVQQGVGGTHGRILQNLRVQIIDELIAGGFI